MDSEREANSETKRMDSQRAAGQGDAKAHSKTHRAPYGRPQAPIGGRLGLWVLLRFRLTLAGRALRIQRPRDVCRQSVA